MKRNRVEAQPRPFTSDLLVATAAIAAALVVEVTVSTAASLIHHAIMVGRDGAVDMVAMELRRGVIVGIHVLTISYEAGASILRSAMP